MNYLPLCRSKNARPSFIFGTQIEIFLMKFEAFWPCLDSNATNTFKAQGNEDIDKIVYGTSVVQPYC